MKKAIVVLSIILVLLVIIAAVLYASDRGMPEVVTAAPSTAEPSTQPTTESPPTEPPTTEPPTTTEPPLELILQEDVIYLNGETVALYEINGQDYIAAETFAARTGLTVDGLEPMTMSGRLDQITVSEDGSDLTVNGQTTEVTDAVLVHEDVSYILFHELVAALNYPIYTDSESGDVYITPSCRPFEIPADVNVPVLMYHAVSDNMWGINELFVSPSEMEKQLAYLVDNGYDAIWFEDLAHLEDYDKPVILTFDDGYDDNYTELYPLLQKYGVKATIFVIGNAAGTSHKMTEEQIKELADSGLVSIQSHAYTHDDLDYKREESLVWELGESQRVIARITGRVPYVLCYPTGKYSSLTLEVGERYYLFGLKMNGGLYNTSDDPFLVNRYYISRYTDIYSFASYISEAGT